MRITTFLTFLFCFTLTLHLKPKEDAHNLLSGKLAGSLKHDLRRNEQHYGEKLSPQHRNKQQNHDGKSYSSTSDFYHAKKIDNKEHQLFGHSSSFSHDKEQNHDFQSYSYSYSHQVDKRQNHKLGQKQHKDDSYSYSYSHQNNMKSNVHNKNQQQHDYSSYSYSYSHNNEPLRKHEQQHDYDSYSYSYSHQAQNSPQQHSKDQTKHQMISSTSSLTSESDFYHKKDQTHKVEAPGTQKHMQKKLTHEGNSYSSSNQYHRKKEKKQSHEGQTYISSFSSSSDYARLEKGIIYKRHDEKQLHDEFSVQNHKQNDRDEPNNGVRTYYVDENSVIEKMKDQDSSSISSVDLRNFVDYDKPLNPPQQNATSTTTIVPPPTIDSLEKPTTPSYVPPPDMTTTPPYIPPPAPDATNMTYNPPSYSDYDTDSMSSSSQKVFYGPAHLKKDQTHNEQNVQHQDQYSSTDDSSFSSIELHNPNQHKKLLENVDHKETVEQAHQKQIDHKKVQEVHEMQSQSDNKVQNQYDNSPQYTHDKAHKLHVQNPLEK